MKIINKISIKTAGIGLILVNIFTIAMDLSIILKILSYNSIGGGRLGSYEAACQSAIFTILFIICGIPVIAIASDLIKCGKFKNLFKVLLLFNFILIAMSVRLGNYPVIVLIICGIPLIAVASGLIKYERFKISLKVYLWSSFIFMCLGTITNLLGVTLFEKIVMGLATIILAILYFRLAANKSQMENTNLEI